MAKELGLPYMGSKRKLSKKIVDYILAKNPKCHYVYDLFGGGGAVSFEFIQRKQIKQVFYNELNTAIVELLKKIRAEGVTPEFYKWVSREEFIAHKNDNDWYGGLLQTCWSFGNNQKNYIFGKHLEENKRILHEIIVNRCDVSRKQLEELTGLYIDDYYLQQDDIQKRRIEVMSLVKKQVGRVDMEQLQQLQQLQQLERLQRLQQLERLEISNLSAFDVEITTPINETVLYLDPPYIKTAGYAQEMCHKELYEYIAKSPYKIYMSSYESDLDCVFEMGHRSTLGATCNSKKVSEKLFCNQKEELVCVYSLMGVE